MFLLVAAALSLVRALLAACDGAVARLPIDRARALAEKSAGGWAVLALKQGRAQRLAQLSFALELMLVGVALATMLTPWAQPPTPAWLAVVLAVVAAGLAVGLELFLRSLSQAQPERWAMVWAPAERLVLGLVTLPWSLAVASLERVARPFGGTRPDRTEPLPSLEELEMHLSAEAAQGRSGKADAELLRSLIDFSEKTAKEIMVPRTQVVGVDIASPIEEVVRIISEDGHTRLPVFRETLDGLLGMLHSRDLVPLLANPELIRLHDLVRPMFYVPWSKRIGPVLREMQRRRSHLAAVVDEYGGLMGIVTLEDILAEIVGELAPEVTRAEEGPSIERLGDGSALVRASIEREDFARAFGIELTGEGAETLGGWLNQQAGAIPELGERFLLDGYVLQVAERAPTHVRRVRLSPRRPAAVEPPRKSRSTT